MRDIIARDIVNSTITEIVGDHPTLQILQQNGEVLAEAERRSRKIVTSERKRRLARASWCALLALVLWGTAAGAGYYWLLRGGQLTIAELIHDTSNISISALVATIVSALAGVVFSASSYAQKDPTAAETLNTARLHTINARWQELRGLGLSTKDIKQLRKRQRRSQ